MSIYVYGYRIFFIYKAIHTLMIELVMKIMFFGFHGNNHSWLNYLNPFNFRAPYIFAPSNFRASNFRAPNFRAPIKNIY